jgi:hypothetical protein
VSEYRDGFVQALRNGKNMRNCMFSVLEQRHATDFANGPTGVKYYTHLFEAVSAAGVPEAVEEFQSRFFPLLDPHGTRLRAAPPSSDAPTRIRRDGRWLVAAFGVMVLLAGTILGLTALPSSPQKTPALTAAPIPSAAATDPKSTVDLSEATADTQAIAPEPTNIPVEE